MKRILLSTGEARSSTEPAGAPAAGDDAVSSTESGTGGTGTGMLELDAGTESARMPSSDNSNLALFRTCMDGGVDISYFYSALGIENSGMTKSLNNALSINAKERISQILDGCTTCRYICCGIFCCNKCQYKIIALSEALEVLTLPASRWEKECQTYFLKEALVYRRKIGYDP